MRLVHVRPAPFVCDCYSDAFEDYDRDFIVAF